MSRILFVDNDDGVLVTRAEYLEDAGYEVVQAGSYEAAIAVLKEQRFDLAIFDQRLQDDYDQNDRSGLELAKDPRFRSVPKIILTNYPDWEKATDVLSAGPDGLPYVAAYLSKDKGTQAMLDIVRKVLEQLDPNRRALDFAWLDPKGPTSFRQLIALIQPEDDTVPLHERAFEMDDLFRRLLKDYEEVFIHRLAWCRGHRAALLLSGFVRRRVDVLLLTCGANAEIKAEKDHFTWHESQTSAQCALALKNTITDNPLGANLWHLQGEEIDAELLLPLNVFLRQKSDPAVRLAVKNLVGGCLGARWHAPGTGTQNSGDWITFFFEQVGLEDFPFSSTVFYNIVRRLCDEAKERKLISGMREVQGEFLLTFPDETVAAIAYPDLLFAEELPRWLDECDWVNSPVGLDLESILVDPRGRTWLTDFGSFRLAPPAWDYILLETSLRFDLWVAAELSEIREFEVSIWRAEVLDSSLKLHNQDPEMRRFAEAIQEIRHQASRETGRSPILYYVGLLIAALAVPLKDSRKKHTRLELKHLLHRLIFASQLAQLIEDASTKDFNRVPPSTELKPLDFDPRSREVLVGGQMIELSGRELEVFQYLYHNQHRFCSPKEIHNSIFKTDESGVTVSNWTSLNVNRLREALGDKRYILTRFGKGYRLINSTLKD